MATLVQFIDAVTLSSANPSFFSAAELDTVATTLENLRVAVCAARLPIHGQLTIAQDHVFWGKLCGSLTNGSGLHAKVLRVLSLAAYDPNNCAIVVGCLTAVGEALEAFLSSRCDVEGLDAADSELYRNVLACFYRAMEYDFSAQQVLEFVDHKPNLAIGALAAVLGIACPSTSSCPCIRDKLVSQTNWEADVALAVCVSKNVYELSLQATYFDGSSAKGDTGATAVAALTEDFQKFVAQIVDGLVASNLMESSVAMLTDWLACVKASASDQSAEMLILPSFQVYLTNLLAFVANILTKTDDSATVLRKHVASETTLIQSVVMPYLTFTLDMFERGQGASANYVGRNVKTVVLLLKLLSFVTYKVKAFRALVKSSPLLVQRILTQPVLWNSPYQVEFLALCTRLSINAELEDGAAFMDHVAKTTLTQDLRAKLAWRLTSAVDEMYPVNNLSSVYRILEPLFDEQIAVADNTTPAAATYDAMRGEVL